MNNNKNDIQKFLWKKKLYILFICIVFTVIAVIINGKNSSYVAKEKILLGSQVPENNLVETYENLISSSTVLDQVSANLKLNQTSQDLVNSMKVNQINHTNLLEISVYGENEDEIKKIANEISNVFISTSEQIYPENELYVVDRISHNYSNINTAVLIIFTAFLGGIISSLCFVIYCIFDTKLKNSNQIEILTGLRPIITIPNIKSMVKKDFSIKDILEHRSDVFKILMTNIQFLNANNTKSKSILITSPVARDGKTYVASNLAVEFAKVRKKSYYY